MELELDEVIENLEYLVSDSCTDTQFDYIEEIEIATKSLKKQIPKIPIDKTKPDDGASLSHINRHIIVCPSCNGRLKLKSKGRFCDKCGQKLDWRNEKWA